MGILNGRNWVESSPKIQKFVNAVNDSKSVLCEGSVGSAYAFLAALTQLETKRPVLLAVPKADDVEKTARDLTLFTDSPILTYPLMEDIVSRVVQTVSVSDEVDAAKRLRVLRYFDERSQLAAQDKEHAASIVVTSASAMLQAVPSPEQMVNDTLKLANGIEIKREALLGWLSDEQYVCMPTVNSQGEYAVRNDIVDVFPFGSLRPVRLEFWGDEISSIRLFGVRDQRRIKEIDSIVLSKTHFDEEMKSRFVDRLPDDSIVIFANTSSFMDEVRRTDASRVSEIMNALYRFPTVHIVDVASGLEVASESVNLQYSDTEWLEGDFTHLKQTLYEREDIRQAFIICGSDVEREQLENGLKNDSPDLFERLTLVEGSLSAGFYSRDDGFVFASTDQIFGRMLVRRTSDASAKYQFGADKDSFLELVPGKDFVVHEDHGIAKYLGIVSIDGIWGRPEDHFKLQFKNRHVYVPVSKIGKLQRYVGVGKGMTAVHLSTYDPKGATWNKKKGEVWTKVWEQAQNKLALQATREMTKGFAFKPDGDDQLAFESLFPFRETDDQLKAIAEVKEDMEGERPMDRLLCGDVGFGKTEVAFRAAFKASMSGAQTAMLVPTTVLVEQHYQALRERTESFPINIARLSRYSPPEEQKTILKKLAMGGIDVVVGTHRLLSSDVEFHNLQLIIVDEEQRFGVRQKEERLQEKYPTVDFLTMTATPIPRTLYMGLLGVRDISRLDTPPADRLPPITKVVRFNSGFIRAAIMRELARNGQVYFLHNNISEIGSIVAQLEEIVPEARVRAGHAKMTTGRLARVMSDFVSHKFDVLVSTTIVENGLDITNANTILINHANRFGLAQLHQLRGRVGRTNKQAYCYLLLDPKAVLKTVQNLRLSAVQDYASLGAGYQIALRDLEIRGAGNILGKEQSGHINEVGFEMYCKMFAEAVRLLNNEPQKLHISVEVCLPVISGLSSDYIEDEISRNDFYRRFDRVETLEEADELRDELKDRFGKLPITAENVCLLSKIRVVAFNFRVKRLGIVQVKGFARRLSVQYLDPTRMTVLQTLLQKKGIEISFHDEKNEAYIDLPRDLFGSDFNPKSKALLEYVLGLFNYTQKELDRASGREAAENAYRQIRTSAAAQSVKQKEEQNEAPLKARLRQMKQAQDRQSADNCEKKRGT